MGSKTVQSHFHPQESNVYSLNTQSDLMCDLLTAYNRFGFPSISLLSAAIFSQSHPFCDLKTVSWPQNYMIFRVRGKWRLQTFPRTTDMTENLELTMRLLILPGFQCLLHPMGLWDLSCFLVLSLFVCFFWFLCMLVCLFSKKKIKIIETLVSRKGKTGSQSSFGRQKFKSSPLLFITKLSLLVRHQTNKQGTRLCSKSKQCENKRKILIDFNGQLANLAVGCVVRSYWF